MVKFQKEGREGTFPYQITVFSGAAFANLQLEFASSVPEERTKNLCFYFYCNQCHSRRGEHQNNLGGHGPRGALSPALPLLSL